MAEASKVNNYWELAPIKISGVERAGELLALGRSEEATDLFISAARAVWTNRWQTVRSYTLKRLGESLDVTRFPELAKIAAALADESPNATSGGAASFVEYLRHRKSPDMSHYIHKPAKPAAGFDPATAVSFSLWQAFAATGDATYKKHLDARVSHYLDPVTVISWHETNIQWARLVCSAIHHGGLPDETICKLVLFGLDYSENSNVTCHLSEPTQPSVGGNHLINVLLAWMTFAALFPEFRRTPALLRAGLTRLDDELSKQVTPDGSMIEGAPGYQNCCIYLGSEFLKLCKRFNLEVPATTHKAWESMLRFALDIMKPNFRTPMLGDSQDEWVSYAAGMEEFFPWPDLRHVMSEGKEGAPPKVGSVAFPCIGYYVQRTGFSPDSLYLCFDGGRFGQAHHHEDKLHFEAWAHGRMFLVDPGVHSYSDHWFRGWSVLSAAHNTILIDGIGQCRWREDRDRWYSHVPLKNRFETGATWDIVEASFDGPYERNVGAVKMKRRIVMHRGEPAFWWITDWIEGSGEHEITETFHFAHDVEKVEAIAGGVRTQMASGPDMALILLYSGGIDGKATQSADVKLYCGAENPPRGWVSPARNTLEKAWEADVTGRAKLPLRRDFLLLPWKTALPQDVAAMLHFSKASPRVEIRVGGKTHEVVLPEI